MAGPPAEGFSRLNSEEAISRTHERMHHGGFELGEASSPVFINTCSSLHSQLFCVARSLSDLNIYVLRPSTLTVPRKALLRPVCSSCF